MEHILFFIVFFLSIIFLPWWVSVLVAVVGVSYFKAYLSVILGGLLFDTLFATSVPALFDSSYVYTSTFVLLVVFVIGIRRFILE